MKKLLIIITLLVILTSVVTAVDIGVNQPTKVLLVDKENTKVIDKIEVITEQDFEEIEYPRDIAENTVAMLGLYIAQISNIQLTATYDYGQNLSDLFIFLELPTEFARQGMQLTTTANRNAEILLLQDYPRQYLVYYDDASYGDFGLDIKSPQKVSEFIYDKIKIRFYGVPIKENKTIVYYVPTINITPIFNLPEKIRERETIFIDFNATEESRIWLSNCGVMDPFSGRLNLTFNEHGNYTVNVSVWNKAGVSDHYSFDIEVEDVVTFKELFYNHRIYLLYAIITLIIGIFLLSLIKFTSSFKKVLHKGCYLLEGKHKQAFSLYKHHTSLGMPGLCITDLEPEELNKKYGIKDNYYLIDRHEGISNLHPNKLEQIQDKILSFIEYEEDNVVLVDGFSILKSYNSFKSVLQMVQNIKDRVSLENTRFMLLVNPTLISRTELANLRTELEDLVLTRVRMMFKEDTYTKSP